MTHLPVSVNVQPGWRFDHYAYPVLEEFDSVGAGGEAEILGAFDLVPEGELWMVQHLVVQLLANGEHTSRNEGDVFGSGSSGGATRVDVFLDADRGIFPGDQEYPRTLVAVPSAASPAGVVFAQPLHVPELHRLSIYWAAIGGFDGLVNNLTAVARAQIAVYKSTDRDRNA